MRWKSTLVVVFSNYSLAYVFNWNICCCDVNLNHLSAVSHHAYLRLRQAQAAGQLFPLGSDHIVILLESPFKAEQLRRRERRPDPFGFPGERTVKQQVLRTAVLPWTKNINTG